MDALIAFLNARLDEDERDAHAATGLTAADLTEIHEPTWWQNTEHGRVYAGDWHMVAQASANHPSVTNTGVLPHIARHDPARTLREVAAKRRILTVHRPYVPEPDQACLGCYGGIEWETCPVLRAMASVYSDHADYQKEWTP